MTMKSYNETEAERLRNAAELQDRLADMAKREGDMLDEAECRALANEYRREARRLEISSK